MDAIYIGGFDLPDKNAAAQRVIANGKALRELGWNVQLVGLDKKPDCFYYEGFCCCNLKYPTTLIEWISYLSSVNNYLPFLDKVHPKMVIAYNHPAAALEKLVDYCKLHDIKVVADCSEWYNPEGNIIKKAIKGWDTKKRMTDVHLRMDGVISISRYLHDYYMERGVKSILLPPLVDIQSEKWLSYDRFTHTKTDEIVLIYTGSPGHKDALDQIVSTVSSLPEELKVRFEIVGLNQEQFMNAYNHVREISGRIHFNGRLSHAETLKLLFTSDFQVFIRNDNIATKAGFPTKFVESITAGVPVLTNLTSNIGDFLSEGVNGFPLDFTSNETLYASLLRVLRLSRESIDAVKKSIDRRTFDYRNYIEQIKHFLDLL